MGILKRGVTTGKKGPNTNNVPIDPTDRLSDLLTRLGEGTHLHENNVRSFVTSCDSIEWAEKTMKREAYKRMQVYALLYCPYDRAPLHTPKCLQLHIESYFGIAFRDCLTPKRKAFIEGTESPDVIQARIDADLERLEKAKQVAKVPENL